MRRVLLGCFVVLALVASLAPRSEAQFAAFTQTQTFSNTSFGQNTTRGFSFTVSTPLIVQQLGFWDSAPPAGLLASHPVAIWTDDGTLLTSATVPAGTAATLDGSYRWVATSAITLQPGHTYVVGGYFTAVSNEPELNTPLNVVFDPRVGFVQARAANTTGLTYPDIDASSSVGWYSANFKAAAAPPLPVLPRGAASALVLLLLGALAWRMRALRLAR